MEENDTSVKTRCEVHIRLWLSPSHEIDRRGWRMAKVPRTREAIALEVACDDCRDRRCVLWCQGMRALLRMVNVWVREENRRLQLLQPISENRKFT